MEELTMDLIYRFLENVRTDGGINFYYLVASKYFLRAEIQPRT